MNQSSPTDVSVVIPTYNGSGFLAKTLESVLAQSLLPRDIIVVDDCSTDQTVEMVRSIAQGSKVPIRLIELESNSGGPARPMNTGVRVAESPFVAMLDQDDLMTPDRLRLSVQALIEHHGASIACGNYRFIDETDAVKPGGCSKDIFPFLEDSQYPLSRVLRCDGDLWFKRFFTNGGLQQSCSNHLFRKSLWEQLGGYREEAKLASDYDFFCRAFRHGVLWLQDILFEKRVHASNTWTNNAQSDLQMAILQDKLVELLDYPQACQWRNEVLLERTRMARWKGRYRLSRLHSARLIKHGRLLDGLTEYTKGLLIGPIGALRNLVRKG